MDTLSQDLRYAARQLRRQPGFAVVAVLTLALGIGAATTIFNAAEVALLRPLPFEHADRLVRIYRVPEEGTPRISLRPETYLAVERRGQFFDRIIGQRYTTFTRTTDAAPERMIGIAVTAGWAETLGVRPLLGRVFSREEERLGAAAGVAVLSHATWQSRFGGDEGVLGREIVLNGRPHTVVGVMRPGMRFPYNADLWVPMRADDPQVGPWSYNVQARLRPGVTLEAVREELRRITGEVMASGEAPALVEGHTLTAYRMRELFVGDEARTTLALLGAVGFLLLIVCANLANLLLAKGLNRGREFAVRASVGASRGRLVRQLLTESLLLGVVGSALGILLAWLGGGLAQPLLPSDLDYVEATVSMNGTVLGFAVGLAVLSTLIFGLLPALRLSRARPGGALLRARGAAGDLSGRALGRSLVVAEIALGIVLLTGTGLVVQDLQRLASVDMGYETDGLLTFSMSLSREPYDEPSNRPGFLERAAAELRASPGVAAAGVTSMFPSDRGNSLRQVEVAGREDSPGTELMVNNRLVTPGFFDALGIEVVEGRGITERDRADTRPVAVVSRAMADRFWPDESPIGQQVRRVGSGEDDEWMTVVGIVDDVREFFDVRETWYLPYAQHADERSASNATFAVRGATGAAPSVSTVRRAMADVAPELPLVDVITARELHASSLTRQRQAAGLSAAFAGFGLLLAAIGLYGSIAYAVNRRRREFGIRMALGSDRTRILRGVVGEGMRLVVVGTAIGAVGALAVSRLLGSVLETVGGGFDPLPFGVAAAVVAATAVIASVLPARRAARVDPMRVLREE
ncbi:MAG: ABC transporter permease [Gemmatimonadota bacterium]